MESILVPEAHSSTLWGPARCVSLLLLSQSLPLFPPLLHFNCSAFPSLHCLYNFLSFIVTPLSFAFLSSPFLSPFLCCHFLSFPPLLLLFHSLLLSPGSQAPQHCLRSWNYGNGMREQALSMINRWEMQCQSLGPGEEGQMHSNNATQTCTHSTHTEHTHSNPPTISLPSVHTENRKGSDLCTTQRHTDTHRVQAKRMNWKAGEFSWSLTSSGHTHTP